MISKAKIAPENGRLQFGDLFFCMDFGAPFRNFEAWVGFWEDLRSARWLQLSSYNCRRSLDQSKKSGIPFQDAFWPPLGFCCSKSLGTSHISLPLTTRFSRWNASRVLNKHRPLPAMNSPPSENPYHFKIHQKPIKRSNWTWKIYPEISINFHFSALDSPRIQKHLLTTSVVRFEVVWRMRRPKSTSLPEGPAVGGRKKAHLLRYVAAWSLVNMKDRLKFCGS